MNLKRLNMIQDFFKMDNFHILMILIGSLIAITGAFLLNFKNSNDNQKLHRKVELSIQKSEDAINHITGGDSWCYMNVNIIKGNTKSKVYFNLEHKGVYPIPEVRITISGETYESGVKPANGIKRKSFKPIHQEKITWCGMDMFPTSSGFLTDLAPNRDEIEFRVDIGAPNGVIIQEIIFKKDSLDDWFMATRVQKLVFAYNTNDTLKTGSKSAKPQLMHKFIDEKYPNPEKISWKDKD